MQVFRLRPSTAQQLRFCAASLFTAPFASSCPGHSQICGLLSVPHATLAQKGG